MMNKATGGRKIWKERARKCADHLVHAREVKPMSAATIK